MPQRLRTEGLVLVSALPVVALFVYWAAHGGGYAPTTWLPSALLVLGLLVATTVGFGLGRLRLSRPAALALALLAAYVAFSYLSIAWAPVPGDALEGSNRALLYLLLFALFALLPWRAWTALTALSAFAVGVGVVAVVTLARLDHAGSVATLFMDGRLSAPVDYVNGAAALFLTAAIVSIALAAQRPLPVALRALLLALATASLQASVLPESRGWLFALPLVAILALALTPGRLRVALWALPPLAGTLVALPALLDVFERVDAAHTPAAARRALVDAAAHASHVALAATVAVLLVGLALALVDERTRVSAPVTRRANQVAAALAVGLALAGVVAGLAATDGRPDRAIGDYWDRANGYHAAAAGSSRFVLAGSNRPDFWRVALDATAGHPFGGLGQDNWAEFYLRHGRSDEQPRWTHSLELRLLAHTGIVGFLLFAGFLAAAVVAALRGRRRAGRWAAVAGAVALLPAVVWVVHGSVDWFWEIPALSGPALAFLALAGALMRQDAGSVAAPARARPRALAGAALGGLALLAAAALALPYLAAREVAAASAGWQADPARALERLDRAAALDPLSARARLVAGTIALELGRPRLAETQYGKAQERSRDDWFAAFGRGLAAYALGDRVRARAEYERARSLDPREPLLRDALARLDGRRPLTAREAFARLRRDVQRLSGDAGAG